jgi:hypothetical protein
MSFRSREAGEESRSIVGRAVIIPILAYRPLLSFRSREAGEESRPELACSGLWLHFPRLLAIEQNDASLLPDTLQKQDRTRIIYSKAITADHSICRKIEPSGQIQFTWLGTKRRDSKQRESLSQVHEPGFDTFRCGAFDRGAPFFVCACVW